MQSQLSIHSQGLLSSTGFRFFPEKVVHQNPNYPQIKTMKTKSHTLPNPPKTKTKNSTCTLSKE